MLLVEGCRDTAWVNTTKASPEGFLSQLLCLLVCISSIEVNDLWEGADVSQFFFKKASVRVRWTTFQESASKRGEVHAPR